MIDSSLFTNIGGRGNNEDYVTKAEYKDQMCFVLCDGVGGHDCGEVASEAVANYVADKFREKGDYPEFLADAFNGAQENLLALQEESGKKGAMRTTMVVLVVTEEHVKWAHIGDSRLYHVFADGTKIERTRDHSLVQLLCDMGEITEEEMTTHEDRNKILRSMGTEWGNKTFDQSAILERENGQAFVLMTDGFWEYITKEEILECLQNNASAGGWLSDMQRIVEERVDMTCTDNYSAITVRIK